MFGCRFLFASKYVPTKKNRCRQNSNSLIKNKIKIRLDCVCVTDRQTKKERRYGYKKREAQ